MIRSMLKGLMLLFGLCMVAGIVQGVRNPAKKVNKEPAKQRPAAKASAEEDAAGKDIMMRAYAVGKTLSKAGAIKPTRAEIDAMSRRLQSTMGDTHSQMWFKQYFEIGFWEGWKGR